MRSVKPFVESFFAILVEAFSIIGGMQSDPPAFDGIAGGITMAIEF
jgi:hypothetical protein